jgi:hypothetical protein
MGERSRKIDAEDLFVAAKLPKDSGGQTSVLGMKVERARQVWNLGFRSGKWHVTAQWG